jgi:hypothetical protein
MLNILNKLGVVVVLRTFNQVIEELNFEKRLLLPPQKSLSSGIRSVGGVYQEFEAPSKRVGRGTPGGAG